ASIFSVYDHVAAAEIEPGQRVAAGAVVARVGGTGPVRDGLHFEIHVAPAEDSSAVTAATEGFPRYAVNPQLWIEPMPGTGVVAGRVVDEAGELVPSARIYGLVLPYPEEKPFSF